MKNSDRLSFPHRLQRVRVAIFPFAILCILGLGCSQCSTDSGPARLPDATHEGANTFGFLDNGAVSLPCARSGLGPAIFAIFSQGRFGGRDLTISAQNNCDLLAPDFAFSIFRFVGELRRYEFGVNPIDSTSEGEFYGQFHTWNLLQGHGSVTFTKFDTVKHIASGTFEFNGMAEDSVLHTVTDGRFDVIYHF